MSQAGNLNSKNMKRILESIPDEHTFRASKAPSLDIPKIKSSGIPFVDITHLTGLKRKMVEQDLNFISCLAVDYKSASRSILSHFNNEVNRGSLMKHGQFTSYEVDPNYKIYLITK